LAQCRARGDEKQNGKFHGFRLLALLSCALFRTREYYSLSLFLDYQEAAAAVMIWP
jgi:hypothetical protein